MASSPIPTSPIDAAILRTCAAAGIVATVLVVLGLVVVGDFIPPQDPSAGADEIARFYQGHVGAIRTGMLLTMVGFSLFVPYGIAVAVLLRDAEWHPTLTYVQVASVAIATVFAVMTTFVWSTAAYRPHELAAETIRMLNDLGWFGFLFTIPPFTIWIAAIGVTILRDRRGQPAFPRWAGYLNLWVSVFIAPGVMMTYFKTGPFAYNGALALYLPFSAFFAWIVIMCPLMFRALRIRASTPRDQE